MVSQAQVSAVGDRIGSWKEIVILILVEGADRAGKSTLVDRLRLEVERRTGEPVKVLHRGPPTRHPLDEYVLPLVDYRPGGGPHVICDRWHVGERVYPSVLGRPTKMDDGVRRYVELFLRSRGALLVLVSGHPSRLARRLRESVGREGPKTSGVTPEHVMPLLLAFDAAAQESTLWVRYVPVAERVDVEDVEAIVTEAEDLAADAAALSPFTTYAGPSRPRGLILGDVRGDRLRTDDLRPAFMPYPSTSGHFLATSLGAYLPELGVANACDVDDPRELWQALGRPPVVALGANAWRETRRIGLDAAELPHPQYVRRFQHRQAGAYGQAIGDAVGKHGPRAWNLRAGWPNH